MPNHSRGPTSGLGDLAPPLRPRGTRHAVDQTAMSGPEEKKGRQVRRGQGVTPSAHALFGGVVEDLVVQKRYAYVGWVQRIYLLLFFPCLFNSRVTSFFTSRDSSASSSTVLRVLCSPGPSVHLAGDTSFQLALMFSRADIVSAQLEKSKS